MKPAVEMDQTFSPPPHPGVVFDLGGGDILETDSVLSCVMRLHEGLGVVLELVRSGGSLKELAYYLAWTGVDHERFLLMLGRDLASQAALLKVLVDSEIEAGR